jgi:hypothetical protein
MGRPLSRWGRSHGASRSPGAADRASSRTGLLSKPVETQDASSIEARAAIGSARRILDFLQTEGEVLVLGGQGARLELADRLGLGDGGQPAGMLGVGRALQLRAKCLGAGFAGHTLAVAGDEPCEAARDERGADRRPDRLQRNIEPGP